MAVIRTSLLPIFCWERGGPRLQARGPRALARKTGPVLSRAVDRAHPELQIEEALGVFPQNHPAECQRLVFREVIRFHLFRQDACNHLTCQA